MLYCLCSPLLFAVRAAEITSICCYVRSFKWSYLLLCYLPCCFICFFFFCISLLLCIFPLFRYQWQPFYGFTASLQQFYCNINCTWTWSDFVHLTVASKAFNSVIRKAIDYLVLIFLTHISIRNVFILKILRVTNECGFCGSIVQYLYISRSEAVHQEWMNNLCSLIEISIFLKTNESLVTCLPNLYIKK